MFGSATIWGTWVMVLAVISLPGIYVLPITFTSSAIALFIYVLTTARRQSFTHISQYPRFMRLIIWVALLEAVQSSLYLVSYSIAIQDGGSVVIPIIRSLAGIGTPILATFSTNERFSKLYLVYGTLSSLGAILIFSRGGIVAGENLSYVALIMVVVSVVVRSWFYLEQRKIAQEITRHQLDTVSVLTAQLLTSSVMLVIVSVIYATLNPQPITLNVIEQIAFLAIVGLVYTGLPSLLRLFAMKQITAQQSIIIMYFEPFLSVMLSILFLGETVTIGFFIGAGLILFSAGATSLHASQSSTLQAPPYAESEKG